MKRTAIGLLTVLALALRLGSAMAEPTKSAQRIRFGHKPTIEITVLFPAGSSADITARLLADGIARSSAPM